MSMSGYKALKRTNCNLARNWENMQKYVDSQVILFDVSLSVNLGI